MCPLEKSQIWSSCSHVLGLVRCFVTMHDPLPPRETPAANSVRRALVVDDHEDSAKSLELMLQSLGFETEIAGDGIDALRRAAAYQPDLLLLDISMPKLDGYDTCRVIRAQPWAQDVRLVAVTGHDPEGLRELAEKAGFDAWLLKPVDFADLRRVAGTEDACNLKS